MSIGLVTRLTARWSFSTMLLRYFTCPSNKDWEFAAGIDLIHGRLFGAALVHGDPSNNAALLLLVGALGFEGHQVGQDVIGTGGPVAAD